MKWSRNENKAAKLIIYLLVGLLSNHGILLAADSNRIYPTGKVTLYRGEQPVGVYTREAPLPEGTVMATEGRCAAKLEDLYLVGEDQSVFSISTSSRQRNLFLSEGIVYFKTGEMRRSLNFVTPNGLVSVQRIRLHAGLGDSTIKGYVSVSETQSEIGVAEGGSMDVLTDEGPMTIQAGKKLILAQADMDIGLPEDEEPSAQEPPPAPESKPAKSDRKKVVYGALGVGAIAVIALGLGGGGGGGGGGPVVSPSSP
jgi:ferric-dicitrate binding protein FerR (iron transport regulator)